MPTVDQNRLKGNFAAAYVSALLSGECLVRPVVGDTDIGLDLYCESVESGTPFLHFWIQVKSGAQCKLSEDKSSASCRFDRQHLDYWRRQPVPVFVALVPTLWPVTQNPDVFIVDITRDLLVETEVASQAGRKLRSCRVWRSGVREDVRDFLREHVPTTAALLQCRNGVIAQVPQVESSYINKIPLPPIVHFRDQLLSQLRRTASMGVLAYRANKCYQSEEEKDSEFRRLLARIAAQFTDDDHWETYAARAFSSHLDGDYATAVELYGTAIDIIKRDPNLAKHKNYGYWEDRLSDLEDQCARARAREPPA